MDVRLYLVREWLRRRREDAENGLARLVPKRIAYWVFIQQGIKHIRPDEVVSEVAYMDVLKRMAL